MNAGKSNARPKIFLIAAEESGDRLGAGLIKALRERLGSAAEIVGVGGRHMAEQGLTSLVSIDELAIIGFVSIPMKLPMILRRLREATDAVLKERPDVLVLIDSPDFTHRVARRVRARNPSIPVVNYVPPTVWVWRGGRAKKMRAYVDQVLAVLPFETEVHRKLGGPSCSYVGHPLLDELDALRPNAQELARRTAAPPLLVVLPGSRRSEIKRNMAIFGETLRLLRSQGVTFEPVLATTPELLTSVRIAAERWPVQPRIVDSDSDKRAAFRNARAALAKSGTVTLELALAGVPMVTAYRVTEIEAFVARRVIQTSSIILANLILGENVIPEFLQQDFTAEKLAPALGEILSDTPARQRQVEAFGRLEQIMSTGGKRPSELAADGVIAMLR